MTPKRASSETIDRPFFGRKSDLEHLLTRARMSGLTVTIGRPQEGKTRLLEETRDRLRADGFVVGHAESTGEYSDLLLRALKDAYAHASTTGKLSALVAKAKRNSASVLVEVSVAVLAAVLPDRLQKVLDLSKRAAAEVRSMGLDLPRLTYDEALSLTGFLATASDLPIVLILDAWEKCSPLTQAAAQLQVFLDHSDIWPACHFFLGARPDDPSSPDTKVCILDLERRSPLTEVRELGRIDLRDSTERTRLLNYLAEHVPATHEINQALTLKLLGGYPGVLHRWLKMKPTTLEELQQHAEDAQLYRYPELPGSFHGACSAEPKVGAFLAGLAILPQFNDTSIWQLFSPVVLNGVSTDDLSVLRADGVLEAVDTYAVIPSYGHGTRHEAARNNWLNDEVLAPIARREAARLVLTLAAGLTDVDAHSPVVAFPLVSLAMLQDHLQLDEMHLCLCSCAASMLSIPVDSDLLLRRVLPTAKAFPDTVCLLAMGLVNIQVKCSREDTARRDAVLNVLRELATAHPKEAAVRHRLATALFNAHLSSRRDSDLRRREALLDELRKLEAMHPRESAVREWYVMAAVNAHGEACNKGKAARRDELLDELRALQTKHGDETALRRQLAMALSNAMADAWRWEDTSGFFALLAELLALVRSHAEDKAVCEPLRNALVGTLNNIIGEPDQERRTWLLHETRQLGDLDIAGVHLNGILAAMEAAQRS